MEEKAKDFKTISALHDVRLIPHHYYNKTFERGFEMITHAHGYIEIMYCITKSFLLEYFAENEKPKYARIPEGSFVLINPGTYHKLIIEEDCKIMNIEFSTHAAAVKTSLPSANITELLIRSETLKNIFDANEDLYIFVDYNLDVKNDIERLILELSAENIDSETAYLIRLLILKTFIGISRCLREIGFRRNYVTYLRKALNYIQSNPDAVTVERLAGVCGISKAYLQRLFKKELGESIVSVVTKVRLHYAKQLLANTDMSTEKIANSCGYKDRRYLLTVFRRHENCTPSQYRQNNKEKEIPAFILDFNLPL
jgi:AraC-like DNA-binding protein